MAHLASVDHQQSSPNSSEEVDSHHATPATKLSAFSPDDTRELINTGGRGIVRAKVPPAFDLTLTKANFNSSHLQGTSSSLTYQDPFVSGSTTTQSSTDASKLSPVASAFTPASLLESPCSAEVTGRSGLSLSVPKNGYRAANQGFPVFSAPSKDPPPCGSLKGSFYNDSVPNLYPTTLQSNSISTSPSVEPIAANLGPYSSEDGTSRSLMVQVGTGTCAEQIEDYLNRETFPSLIQIVLSDLALHGTIYVKFTDIRDADKAFSNVQHREASWAIQHIGPHHFAMKHQPQSLPHTAVSIHEAQVLVSASYLGTPQYFDIGNIGCTVKEVLQHYGEVMVFNVYLAEVYKVTFRAEYYDINSANNALSNVNGVKVAMCTLSIARYEPDLTGTNQAPVDSTGPIIIGQEDTGLEKAFKEMTVSDYRERNAFNNARRSLCYNSTPVARSFTYRKEVGGQHTPMPLNNLTQGYDSTISHYSPSWSPTSNPYAGYGVLSPLWSPYSPGTIGQERGSPMLPQDRQNLYQQQVKNNAHVGGRQFSDFASGHHNVVDVGRISRGEDVRTTIMLRNIPNKIDQAMLKDIIDETSLGKYDFMYLRIDFANNCNVGYAFINFDDPICIVEFVRTRAGRRWNRYNSDKVAEVSYATIQGRDCLVQKFRNSSVMLEHPSFRPKLFHTIGPLLGTEDKFPGPDNPSKMRRSVENAEHVGLFAPRAGQNFRDEQRRRRSQYDRGTRLAEIEDSYEISHHGLRNQPQAFHSPRPFGMFNEPYPSGYGPAYF